MTSFFLSIAIDAAKNDLSYWLLAASLPPFFYLLSKKRKRGWLKKLFLKWAIKRARKRARKNGKMSEGTAILLFILLVLGLGALVVVLLGWAWAIIIVLLGLLIMGSKRSESDYE